MKKLFIILCFVLCSFNFYAKSLTGFLDIPFGTKLSGVNKMLIEKGFYVKDIEPLAEEYNAITYENTQPVYFLDNEIMQLTLFFDSNNKFISSQSFFVITDPDKFSSFYADLLNLSDNLKTISYNPEGSTKEICFKDSITENELDISCTILPGKFIMTIVIKDSSLS